MKIALLISFYNRCDFLSLCLRSISMQTRKPDEIAILDDGSDVTKLEFFEVADFYVRRKFHQGFGKERCANRALMEIHSEYFIMLDQDCVLPPGFIAVHEAHAKRGQAVCGMYTSLTPEESKVVSLESISNGSVWREIARAYEGEPMIWCGSGSAAWRDDAIKINGFDNRFGVVGPDYNLGLRLARAGISLVHSSTWTRYLHLWHERPYAAGVDKRVENALARERAAESIVTPRGMTELDLNEFEVIKNQKGGSHAARR